MKQDSPKTGLPRAVPFILWALIAAQILAVCIMAAVPPVCRDSLSHHLAVPKLYLQHGGMVELPDVRFSYYPMNVGLLYAIPLFFGNDILPKYIHFLFALLTAWLIHGYVRRHAGSTYALLAVLWFLSLPIITVLSISIYVDLGLIFFTTASILWLLLWTEEEGAVRHLIVSAVFCGLALGTKYNGLVALLLLTFITPLAYARMVGNGSRAASLHALKSGVVFAAVALLVFSPWMIRNVVWKGNPVYPLLTQVFQKPTAPAKKAADIRDAAPAKKDPGKTNHLVLRHMIFGESGWEIALIPVRVFFQGQDDKPRYFDGRLNPLLFFLPLCAFLPAGRAFGGRTAGKAILMAFAWLFLFIAFLQIDMRIRYILPIVPPLIILSAFGLRALFESADRMKRSGAGTILRIILFCGVGLSLGYNIDYGIRLFQKVEPLSYITGQVDRDAYIERFRPEYPLYRHINTKLPENAKLLGLFIGNRIYYSDREMITTEHRFQRAALAANTPRNLAETLADQGFSHLMVKHDVFTEWGDHMFDERQRVVVNRFFADHLTMLMFRGGVGLYHIVPTAPEQAGELARPAD